MAAAPKKKPAPKQLLIRCSGRAVNPLNNQPTGRECGRRFSSKAYRSRKDWIERARACGWRVSPPRPDGTVNAMCPTCSGGTTR